MRFISKQHASSPHGPHNTASSGGGGASSAPILRGGAQAYRMGTACSVSLCRMPALVLAWMFITLRQSAACITDQAQNLFALPSTQEANLSFKGSPSQTSIELH